MKIKNLNKKINDRNILSDIGFFLAEGNIVSLIGSNGVGKTTLIKIIAGVLKYDSGTIDFNKKEVLYIPQEFDAKNQKTIREYFNYHNIFEEYKIEKLINLFDLDKTLDDDIHTLSPGQKTKLDLFLLHLLKTDIYLLDEPTNNLDMKTTLMLEKFINALKNKMLIVTSHDRLFLHATCNKVMEILRDSHKNIFRKGKYENYLIDRSHEKQLHKRKYKEYIIEKKRLEDRAYQIKERSTEEIQHRGKIGHLAAELKQKKADRTAKALESRASILEKIEKPVDFEPPKFNINGVEELSKEDKDKRKIELNNVSIGFDKPLISDIDLAIDYGDRVCFTGTNGVGKTTLIKSLIDNKLILSGDLYIGEDVVFANVVQDQQKLINSEETIEEFLSKIGSAGQILKDSGLDEEVELNQKINTLSPGQRMRVFIATTALLKSNVLILDEPTNHLDIDSVEALEFLLENYPGTIILISHDRFFLDRIKGFKIHVIKDQKIDGGEAYKDYLGKIVKEVENIKYSTFLNNL